MKRHAFALFLFAAIVGQLAGAACTADDRSRAARTALDAVDKADRTCTDLHEALHRDAGGVGENSSDPWHDAGGDAP